MPRRSAAIAAQQQQIQELRDELHRKDQAVQQATRQATDASSKADAAQARPASSRRAVVELKSDVTDLKTNVTNTASEPAGNTEECEHGVGKPAGAALQGNHDYAGRFRGG